jgi:uncharacterized protein (TIGR00730 family)
MNVTVFCSAQEVNPTYVKAAQEFATLIGSGGHTLVWGGSDRGTMKVIADAAQQAGGRIVGISVEPIKVSARPNADEMIIAKNWPERRALLLSRGDVIVVLLGGIGTLDEVTEVLEYKKQKLHDKPVLFLNVDGFYNGFKMQLERMAREGFFGGALLDLLVFVDTPEEAMQYITHHGN